MRRSFVAVSVLLAAAVAALAWVPPAPGRGAPGRTSSPAEAVLGISAVGVPEIGGPEVGGPTVSPSPTTPPSSTPSPHGDPSAPLRPRIPAKPASTTVTFRAAGSVRAVALGDSLTAWPSGNPWPRRLDAIDPVVVVVHNAGVPGNTTSQMRARFGSDVLRYSPGLLFVLGGTNDVGLGIGRSTTIANLRAIVRAGKANGMTVVLITIPPDSYPALVARVRSLNAAIRALAASEGVAVADIYTPLATSAGLYRSGDTVDGLHFSNVATQIVANTVRARIAALGL